MTHMQPKAKGLRGLLQSSRLEFIMEAHNGLSSKIVEETGFKGIWGSGLSISAALGVRDNNEASWTQVLDVLEFMSDATAIPILMDGDTGFGNFNNMRRLVQKLEQRDIAGVAIEDKLFPKTNSFIGEMQPLADMDEFCGKIKAGKDSQKNDDFCVVARVEAFIAGWGLKEAMRRAEAYRVAGADAILMHSKLSDPSEIFAFLDEWAGRSPVVVVPTMYYSTPVDELEKRGVSLVIWANHNVRSVVTSMRETSREIFQNRSIEDVESRIASVRDIFELQNSDELKQAEGRYLPKNDRRQSAIVLAASRGGNLGELTVEIPKCMLDIRGKKLLQRLIDNFNDADIRSIAVVRGYKKETIDIPGISKIDNDDFKETGEAWSLNLARQNLSEAGFVAYGDILCRSTVLSVAMRYDYDITLIVDARPGRSKRGTIDYVTCSRPYTGQYFDAEETTFVTRIGADVQAEDAQGEWIGIMHHSTAGAAALRGALAKAEADGVLKTCRLTHLISQMIEEGVAVGACYIEGQWLDIDDVFDLAAARNMV